MISPLRLTNEQIAATQRAHDRREWARRELDRPIAHIDSLIAECEELLLIGRKRVPTSMEPGLRTLSDLCPEATGEMHAGVTIVRLMDGLFELQGDLLGRRIDRAAYPDPDEAA